LLIISALVSVFSRAAAISRPGEVCKTWSVNPNCGDTGHKGSSWVFDVMSCLTISVQQPWAAVNAEHSGPSDAIWRSTASLQIKISAATMHFTNRNIKFIEKVKYSTSNISGS